MSAKEIIVKPISSTDANKVVQSCHYSGKGAINSQLNFGVFLNGRCGGAMQFGPSLQKSHIQHLVEETGWNDFLELNRMAFADWLPRNSESRALSVAMRLIRKHYPNIEWVISFADGTQCGDGTIYRASGFSLTGIKQNTTMWQMPDGFVFADVGLRASSANIRQRVGYKLGEPFSKFAERVGAKKVSGYMLRYIYFLNPAARSRLTVPILPFSEIQRRNAGMYKGQPIKRGESIDNDASGYQPEEGGVNPTSPLHSSDA